jgi:16S rRNA (guanine527-N7)-methyltransferase
LQQVKATLKLDNVEVFHQRLDQLKSENCYDIVISRAFGSFDDMLPSIKLLCDNGGKIFSMKGQYDTIMQETVPKQLKVDEIIELETSTTNMNRHLVILSPDFILESEGSNSGNR